MKTLVLLFCLVGLGSQAAWSFEVPKSFEPSDGSTKGQKLWIDKDTLQTVSVSDEDVSNLPPSKDAVKELKATLQTKASILSLLTNISDWKVTKTDSDKSKTGDQLVWLSGTYKDSTNKMTYFTEVYSLHPNGHNQSYLFTRTDNAWSKDEITKKFKVGLE